MVSMDEAIDFLGRFDPLWAVALAAVVLGIVLLVRFWRSTLAYVLAGVLAFGLVGALDRATRRTACPPGSE